MLNNKNVQHNLAIRVLLQIVHTTKHNIIDIIETHFILSTSLNKTSVL